MKDSVLIVEDDELTLEAIRKILLYKTPFDLSFANTYSEAIGLMNKKDYSLLLTDLYLGDSSAFNLLDYLNQMVQKPKVIVFSNNSEIELAVELFRKGAHDYLTKPVETQKLISAVERGLNNYSLEQLKENLYQEKLQTQNQEWENYRSKILKDSHFRNKFQILDSIRTSFSQGAGLGALLSVLQRIQKKAKKGDGYYQIPESLMEILFENSKATHRILKFFEELEELNSSEDYEEIPLPELHLILRNIIDDLNFNYATIKNQKIIMSEKINCNEKYFIKMKRTYFEKIITEILLNACKFSLPNSKIFIIWDNSKTHLELAFLNSPETAQNGVIGIPSEYSELIFEPFFRMSKFVHENYPTLDFGLGLSYVERAILKYGGKVSARNIKSHIPSTGKILTLFELNFEVSSW